MSTPAEFPPKQRAEGVSDQQLRQWVETGFSNNAVASFGTSVERLQDVLKSNIIPSIRTPLRLPYQQRLLGRHKGADFYYVTPIFDRILKVRPALAKAIGTHLNPDYIYDPEFARRQLSVKDARRKSESYAHSNSVQDFFYTQTGIFAELTDILAIARGFNSAKVEEYIEDTKSWGAMDDLAMPGYDTSLIDALKTKLNRSFLESIVFKCLERRGAVIYYNQGLLAYPVKLGREGDLEIMIVSSEPVSANVISGIEILSQSDKKSLVV